MEQQQVRNYIEYGVPFTEPVALFPSKRYVYRVVKRLMDIVLSAVSLIVLSPLMLITALLIKLDSPGPVFFKQKRVGLNGKSFVIYKFRSMCQDAEKQLLHMTKAKKSSAVINLKNQTQMHFGRLVGNNDLLKTDNDPRVTSFGKFIRKTSIDELPQFFNVFLGKMSLVGPRPLPVYECEAMNSYQKQRELAKPGITCFWQVEGRSSLDDQERIELDLKYIREQNVVTDIILLFKTIPAIISRKGAV